MKYAFRYGIAAVGLAIVAATAAQAQVTYPPALNWGAGLVDIPVAWVSPISGDMAVGYSGRMLQSDPELTKLSWSDRMNQKLSMSLTGWGRLEAGWAAYSENPEWGFFGKALLLNENDLNDGGFMHWIVPSLAVGVRNVGPYSHIDRFGSGYILTPPQGPGGNSMHVADSLHQNFNTGNTVYGVATKSWSLQQISSTMPDLDLGLTVGYGNGLFKEDGGLGTAYAKHATGGLFYGANVNFTVSPHLTMTVMGENNAWDYNVGASLLYRGVRAGVYLTELGAGSAAFNTGRYNLDYQKVAFQVGWQSNLFALVHGDFLERKEASLLRERQGLLAEIAVRQQRIAALELEINRYEAQGLLDLEQRRAAADVQLREERASLQRLEDRLKRVEQQLPPEATKTPTQPNDTTTTPPTKKP